MTSPSITLTHPAGDPIELVFDSLDRTKPWLNHMVLFLWAIPRPVIGFIHPLDAYEEEDEEGNLFMLQHTLEFHGVVGMQQAGPNSFQPVEGPKVLLPFSLISPLDIQVSSMQGSVWVRDQDERFKEVINALIMNFMCPPLVKTASLLEMPR